VSRILIITSDTGGPAAAAVGVGTELDTTRLLDDLAPSTKKLG